MGAFFIFILFPARVSALAVAGGTLRFAQGKRRRYYYAL